MNKTTADQLTGLINVQRNCLDGGAYMVGLYNGLLIARAIVDGDSPQFEAFSNDTGDGGKGVDFGSF